jgi:hypothetical protein
LFDRPTKLPGERKLGLTAIRDEIDEIIIGTA